MARPARGLTLIEMLVALAVFAVLGVLAYRGVATALEARQRLAAETARWRDLDAALRAVERDLAQWVARPGSANGLVLNAGAELGFVRLDGANGGVGRRGYRLDGRRLVQRRWPGVDAAGAPAEHVLLDGVRALRLAVLAADGARRTQWPPAGGQNAVAVALELELEIADAGTVRRLLPLR